MIQPLQVIESIGDGDLTSVHTAPKYPLGTKITILPSDSEYEQEWEYMMAVSAIPANTLCAREAIGVSSTIANITQEQYVAPTDFGIDTFGFFQIRGEAEVLATTIAGITKGDPLKNFNGNGPFLTEDAAITDNTVGYAMEDLAVGSDIIKVNLIGKQALTA